MGTLCEDLYTFVIMSIWILPRIRNVVNKSCRENQNTCFMTRTFFFKNWAFYETVWYKHKMHCCISIASMVMSTCHNVMLCVHCLSCIIGFSSMPSTEIFSVFLISWHVTSPFHLIHPFYLCLLEDKLWNFLFCSFCSITSLPLVWILICSSNFFTLTINFCSSQSLRVKVSRFVKTALHEWLRNSWMRVIDARIYCSSRLKYAALHQFANFVFQKSQPTTGGTNKQTTVTDYLDLQDTGRSSSFTLPNVTASDILLLLVVTVNCVKE